MRVLRYSRHHGSPAVGGDWELIFEEFKTRSQEDEQARQSLECEDQFPKLLKILNLLFYLVFTTDFSPPGVVPWEFEVLTLI